MKYSKQKHFHHLKGLKQTALVPKCEIKQEYSKQWVTLMVLHSKILHKIQNLLNQSSRLAIQNYYKKTPKYISALKFSYAYFLNEIVNRWNFKRYCSVSTDNNSKYGNMGLEKKIVQTY